MEKYTKTSETTATFIPEVKPIVLDADVLKSRLAKLQNDLQGYQGELARQSAPIQANIDETQKEIVDIQAQLDTLAQIGVAPTVEAVTETPTEIIQP